MLYYLWSVIQDLFYTVTTVTLMHAFLGRLYGRTGRRGHAIGLWAGIIAGIALAVVKQTTNKIISSHWNHWTYAYLMAFIVAFFMLSLFCGRKEGKKPGTGGICLTVCGAAVSAGMIFFRLPTVLLYPFSFNTMGNGFFSAYYMERLGGWALALLLLFVYSRFLYGCAVHIRKSAVPRRILRAGVLLYAVYCLGRFFVPWISRARWLGWSVKYTEAEYGWIGSFTMWTATNAMIFIWAAAFLAALLALLFLLENTKVTEPYEHAAQLRKLRAGNRKRRRLAIATLVMVLLFVLTLTVVKAYDLYHAKGFEVVGVSLDNNKEAWIKAIDQLKMPWPHMSDIKGWGCAGAALYNVKGIPANVLIDQQGKIVAKNLRGQDLLDKMAELLK